MVGIGLQEERGECDWIGYTMGDRLTDELRRGQQAHSTAFQGRPILQSIHEK